MVQWWPFAASTKEVFIKTGEQGEGGGGRGWWSSRVHALALDEERRKRSPEFFLSREWAHQSQCWDGGWPPWWWWWGVVGVVLGHLGGYSVREWRTDKLIWPASWLHLRRLSRSPCHWGRCWWTLRACRRCSGTSRWRSSLWGCQSHGTSWLPPGGRHQKLELSPNWALYSLETPSILSAICISSELI